MSNLSRWLNYAKARLDAAIGQGNRELDELEAERESELADKPWLRSAGDAPTFDEARARIEWEAEQAARAAGRQAAGEAPTGGEPGTGPAAPASPGAGGGTSAAADEGRPGAGAGLTSPEERAAAAEAATARLEMEERQRESAARLDAIRRELGIEPGDEPPA